MLLKDKHIFRQKSTKKSKSIPFHTFDNTIDFKCNSPYIILSYITKESR